MTERSAKRKALKELRAQTEAQHGTVHTDFVVLISAWGVVTCMEWVDGAWVAVNADAIALARI